MFLKEEELKVAKDSQSLLGLNKFEKKFRVTQKKDFENLKVDPHVKSFRSFRIYWKQNNLASSRIAIGVSRKVGNSILRNRLKRITREQFRISQIKASGFDLMISVNPRYFSSQNDKKGLIKSFGTEINEAFVGLA